MATVVVVDQQAAMGPAFPAARILPCRTLSHPPTGPVPRIKRNAHLQFTEGRDLDHIDMVFTVTVELDGHSGTAEYWVRVSDDDACPLTLEARDDDENKWNLTPDCIFISPDELKAKAQAFTALGLAMEEMVRLLAEKRPVLAERVQRLNRLADRIVTGAPEEEDGADDIAVAGGAR